MNHISGSFRNLVTELLNEAPQKISPTDFGLDVQLTNRVTLKKLMSKKTLKVLESGEGYKLYQTGSKNDNGYFFVVNEERNLIEYLVEYEVNRHKNRSVTQTAVWRKTGGQFSQSITEKMFFGLLLNMHGVIKSDSQQTVDGESFWRNMLVKATKRNLKVGLHIYGQPDVKWKPTGMQVGIWLDDLDGWGEADKYQSRRFFISKTEF